jgi:hypothetical protein
MGKMAISGSNNIYISLPAGADLTDKEGYAVKVNDSGQAVLCDTLGERPNGVLVIGGATGTDITIQIKGQTKMVASTGGLKSGNALSVTAAAKVKVAATGEFIFAQALENSNSDGHRILVDIINAGKA